MSKEFTKSTRENVKDPKRVYELPDIKKNPPNLENATPEWLVDELGRIRRIFSRAKKLEGYYKEALKARWPMIDDPSGETYTTPEGDIKIKRIPVGMLRGEIYGVDYSLGSQSRVDLDAVTEFYAKHDEEVPRTQNSFVVLRSNGTEDLDEFVIDVGDWDN